MPPRGPGGPWGALEGPGGALEALGGLGGPGGPGPPLGPGALFSLSRAAALLGVRPAQPFWACSLGDQTILL